MSMGLAEVLVAIYATWVLTSIAKSALRNLAARPAYERYRLVNEVIRNSRDPEKCRTQIDALSKRIERRPNDANAYLQRGLYRQTLRDLDGAHDDFCRALEIRPEDAYLLHCRAAIEIHRGETECGIADLDRAIDVDPRAAHSHLLRGLVQHRRGVRGEAERDLDLALSLPTTDFESYLYRAELRMELRQDLEGAENDATAALRLRPTNLDALLLRASSREKRGRHEDAEADFRRIITLDATTADELWVRAYASSRLGEVEASLRDITAARDQDPLNLNIRRSRAAINLSLGEIEEAIVDLDVVIRSEAVNAWDLVQRGQALADESRYREAAADYERAIELDPNSGVAHNNLAWFLSTCPDDSWRNGAAAARHAEKACELLDPLSDYPKGTLAAAHAECGDFARAVEWEEKASALRTTPEREQWAFLLDLYRGAQAYRSPPHYWRDWGRAKRIPASKVVG
jgi:tetratricopeptide (TPR) repeat protein